MKKYFLLTTLLFTTLFTSGCVTTYFPMENKAFFEAQPNETRTVAVMPFEAQGYTYFSKKNNMVELKKAEEQATIDTYNAVKKALNLYNYEVVDYNSMEEVEEDGFDEEMYTYYLELFQEMAAAKYSIGKNLDDDHGKDLNYSIGVRAQELRDAFEGDPDFLLFVVVSGFIYDLNIMDGSSEAVIKTIMNLGMTESNDSIRIEMTLVDADTGKIVWLNSKTVFARSLLKATSISEVAFLVAEDLPFAH